MLQCRAVSDDAFPVGSFPERVGKYELLLPLGTGGTATVYLARSRGVAGFEREVALKLVHAHLRADEESRLHLLEEARLAARIRHPNVVPVIEVDSDSCGVFLVMDYVEGESLSGLVRLWREQQQRIPPRLVARIMNDALAGLHAAHELTGSDGEPLELVHRDFSPQNILVGIEGVARLADFGVAKAASRTVRTKTGLVKGKIAYMSPEQARGYAVDRRCDVWAAGVVIWELITGRKLYDHEDDVAILLSVVTETPPRLSDVMDGIPADLDQAVASALEPDVDQRCPSADALRIRLEEAWSEAGGMASPAELGTFVKETVAEKLAERRARAASKPKQEVATSPTEHAQIAQPPVRQLSSTAAPEEGTKTAISAAVPSAEELKLSKRPRAWPWIAGLAALLVAIALGVSDPSVDSPTSGDQNSLRVGPSGTSTPVRNVRPFDSPSEQRELAPAALSPPAKPQEEEKKTEESATKAVAKRKKPKRSQAKQRSAKSKRNSSKKKSTRRRVRPKRKRTTQKTKAESPRTRRKRRSRKRSSPPPLLLAPDPYRKGK